MSFNKRPMLYEMPHGVLLILYAFSLMDRAPSPAIWPPATIVHCFPKPAVKPETDCWIEEL